MQTTWHVLAPIDLSIEPEGPVEHAMNIARAMDADLTLLYVADPAWRKAPRWPSNAVNQPGDIHRLILPGHPAETISRYAEFINADLLAMTSENYVRWSRFWKHSVTEDVMGRTGRPLCVTDLRSVDTDYRFRSRRILCALSLDGTDDPLILQAEALAQQSGGELILLGVVPANDEGLLLESLPGYDRPLSPNLAVERIRVLGNGISVPYRTSIEIGSAYNCIRDAAQKYRADIVMAARPSPGQRESNYLDMRWLLRRLPCPLVSVTEGVASTRSNTQKQEAAVPEFAHASIGNPWEIVTRDEVAELSLHDARPCYSKNAARLAAGPTHARFVA